MRRVEFASLQAVPTVFSAEQLKSRLDPPATGEAFQRLASSRPCRASAIRSRTMRTPTLATSMALAALVGMFAARQAVRAESPVSFNRDIRAILSNNCFKCHGPDPGQRKGVNQPLRLD